MSSLLNSSWSGLLNSGSYLNEGGSALIGSVSAEAIVTTIATLGQSSILEPTGFRKDLKVTTNLKQIIVKGI
jgi:hypothetical protein